MDFSRFNEAWLTLPIRLCLVAFVGFTVWNVVQRPPKDLQSALTGQTAIESDELGERGEFSGKRIPDSIAAILAGITAAVVVYALLEWIRFVRFSRAVAHVKKMQGSVAFDPDFRSLPLRFIFSIATIDLSATDVCDDTAPALHATPRLTSVRLADTKIGSKTVQMLTRCKSLKNVDLTGTSLSPSDLAVLHSQKRLINLLV